MRLFNLSFKEHIENQFWENLLHVIFMISENKSKTKKIAMILNVNIRRKKNTNFHNGKVCKSTTNVNYLPNQSQSVYCGWIPNSIDETVWSNVALFCSVVMRRDFFWFFFFEIIIFTFDEQSFGSTCNKIWLNEKQIKKMRLLDIEYSRKMYELNRNWFGWHIFH